jgi:Fe-S-cluster-containing dehydrogenase component
VTLSKPSEAEAAPERSRYALVIDLDRCIGCWACAIACKMKNNLAEGEWWLRVDTVTSDQRDLPDNRSADQRTLYRPVIERCSYSAQQATRGRLPDCVKACPVEAMRFGEQDRAGSRVATDVRSPDATHAGNPPGSVFVVTYLPARTQARQRRSGYLPS